MKRKSFTKLVAAILLALPLSSEAGIFLQSTSGTANFTGEVAITTWTADIDRWVTVRGLSSSHNGAAATITPRLKVVSGGITYEPDLTYSTPKVLATSTTYGFCFLPYPIAAGEQIIVLQQSTNTSDTAVVWKASFVDANQIGGVLPAIATASAGGVALQSGAGSINVTAGRTLGGGGTFDSAGSILGSVASVAVGGIGSGAFTANALASQTVGTITNGVNVTQIGGKTANGPGAGSINFPQGNVGTSVFDGTSLASDVTAVKAKTDQLTFTVANKIDTDAYARIGAPVGASLSVDVAAVKSDSAAILTKVGTTGVYVDWSHIQNPTSAVNLSATSVGTVTNSTNLNTASIAAAVWANSVRSLTDKSGFAFTGSIPTASENAAAIWAYDISAASSPSAGNTLRTSASAGSPAGPGQTQHTITWTNTTSHLPIANGTVWVTTDALGKNKVAGNLYTNDQGRATFLLDLNAVYYVWARKSGVGEVRGQQFTATAD